MAADSSPLKLAEGIHRQSSGNTHTAAGDFDKGRMYKHLLTSAPKYVDH